MTAYSKIQDLPTYSQVTVGLLRTATRVAWLFIAKLEIEEKRMLKMIKMNSLETCTMEDIMPWIL